MQALTRIAALATVVGCSNATPAGNVDNPNAPGPEIADTGWPAGDIGSLHYDFVPATGKATLYGAFMESSPGFLNLAMCGVEGPPCLTSLPGIEDDHVVVNLDVELDKTLVNSRFLGRTIEFAGFELPFYQEAATGFGYYVRDITDEVQPTGWVGARWAGQWEDFEGDEELLIGPPIQLISPRAGSTVTFHNGEHVVFDWIPSTDSVITLTVTAPVSGIERMYRLEDDGYFELAADDLGIVNNTEQLEFSIARWNRVQRQRFGHVVDYVASSRSSVAGEYFNIGNRTHLPPSDRCSAAQGSPALQSGMWWGDLGNYSADLDASDAFCLGGGGASGFDGIYKVEVPPKHLLQVDYNTYDDSASVYLLSDCEDELSCIVGADFDPAVNAHEYLNYFNPTDVMRRFYLVVDATSQPAVDTYYTLDVDIAPLSPPDMFDTCDAAEQAKPIPEGNYYTDFVSYTNTLDPGVGGCTASSLPGNEAMAPVTLAAGETLVVNVRMPGADPGIYLLYDCTNAFSCPSGMDVTLGDSEILFYTNVGISDERLYIVVDSKSGMQPFFMSVVVF